MQFALAALLAVHGLAHLIGFLVPWKIVTLSKFPYGTTILSGTVDLGEKGMRNFGLIWLGVAAVFVLMAGALAGGLWWWFPGTVLSVGVSSVLCVLIWPDGKWGLLVNVGILGLIMAAIRFDWLRGVGVIG